MNLEEVIPQLVEKGHQQVNMARMFGQFAVKAGAEEARKRVEQVSGQVGELREPAPADGSAPARRHRSRSADAPPATDGPATEAPTSTDPVPDAGEPRHHRLRRPLGVAGRAPPRLASLAAELDAVRRYEAANRGRKTILSKIAQLQG